MAFSANIWLYHKKSTGKNNSICLLSFSDETTLNCIESLNYFIRISKLD